MHMSECCDSFRSRRIVDFKRRPSSSGEKEVSDEDTFSEEGADRGGHTAPGFSRSRKLLPGQDRRPLQRCYLEGTCALSRVARGTTASPAVKIQGKTTSR